MMRALGVSAVVAAVTMAAAQEASPFYTGGDCPERTAYWCATKAAEAGWRLKYQDKSPSGMMDKEWDIEIWVRGHEAMLCEFRASLGGIRDNSCQALQEAAQ